MHTGCRYCLLASITIRTSILPSFEQGKLLQIMYLGINVIVKLLLVVNKMELHLLSSVKFLINKTCIDVQSYCCNRLEKNTVERGSWKNSQLLDNCSCALIASRLTA
jgi:hypothetical protein